MWLKFKLSGRELEWCVVLPPPHGRALDIRSCDGEFVLRALLNGGPTEGRMFTGPGAVLGKEFPLGATALDPPFLLHGSENVRHEMITTEFVRSLVQRCSSRGRYRRYPLTGRWMNAMGLS